MVEENTEFDDPGSLGLSEEDLAAYEKEIETAYHKMAFYVEKYSHYSDIDKITNRQLYILAEGHITWYENLRRMPPPEQRRTLLSLLKRAMPANH